MAAAADEECRPLVQGNEAVTPGRLSHGAMMGDLGAMLGFDLRDAVRASLLSGQIGGHVRQR